MRGIWGVFFCFILVFVSMQSPYDDGLPPIIVLDAMALGTNSYADGGLVTGPKRTAARVILEMSQQKTLWATVLEETRKLPGPTRNRDRTNIAELLADQRCSQAVLTLLATADVGRSRRQAHRRPTRMRTRPVRLRSGKRGNRRSGCGRGEGRREVREGVGWESGGVSLSFLSFHFL